MAKQENRYSLTLEDQEDNPPIYQDFTLTGEASDTI
jgi:hypothetical protein